MTCSRSVPGCRPTPTTSLGNLGMDRTALVHSLRYVEPVTSFRTTFAYTNITHVLAGRIVAQAEGAADWNAVLQREILDPLGMKETTYTAAAIEAAANHANGYRFAPDGSIDVPFTGGIPYLFDGAGAINSNIEDMARWVSLQLAAGTAPDGRRVVSAENLAYTHTPKVAMSETVSYALGEGSQEADSCTFGITSSCGKYRTCLSRRRMQVIRSKDFSRPIAAPYNMPEAPNRAGLMKRISAASVSRVQRL